MPMHVSLAERTVDTEVTEDVANKEERLESDSGAWKKYETVFTNTKAGMDNVDKEKVKKVVYEMSKDSAFFQNEQRKMENSRRKIDELICQAEALTAEQLDRFEKSADDRIAELEAKRRLDKVWLHVDMDAFYAAVEERDNPSLKDVPMAVGGTGMITTANYKARRFGVRSAMPGFIARRLCPELVFVRPDFAKYRSAADETRAIFRELDPDFEAMSLDEAYLDATPAARARGLTGAELAEELRHKVLAATGLTCSVGIAPNKRLAKVCSDMNKPNGQFEVKPERGAILDFLRALPIRKIGGIGKVAEQMLSEALSVTECGHLLDRRAVIVALCSERAAGFYLEVGLGLGAAEHSERPGDGEVGRKGISCERTFRAICTVPEMEQKLAELSAHLAEEMAEEGLRGRSLTLKLKGTDFKVRTRAVTSPGWLCSTDGILEAARGLLRAELRQCPQGLRLRLMGLRMSHLAKLGGAPGTPERGQTTLREFVAKADAPGGSERAAPSASQRELFRERSPGAEPGGCHGGLPRQEAEPAAAGSPEAWACRACTFAGNPASSSRCSVCGFAKGTKAVVRQLCDSPALPRPSLTTRCPMHSTRDSILGRVQGAHLRKSLWRGRCRNVNVPGLLEWCGDRRNTRFPSQFFPSPRRC
uniref:DNA polymerase kappa n=1 Tax=Tetraselmis sp. GSL018 TaxID=582737 RepID=A0A061R8V8_9CHLO